MPILYKLTKISNKGNSFMWEEVLDILFTSQIFKEENANIIKCTQIGDLISDNKINNITSY